jgi:uncharacterized protein (TIGR02001 family)
MMGLAGLVLGATASLGATAQAESESAWGPFTANIGVTSDYRFRGQSQTQNEPAVFGGIDYVGDNGFFAGVWASNVDFNDAAETYLEVDLYGGYTFPIDEKTTGTVKVVYYAYPLADYPSGANENDYLEFIAVIGHDFGGASGSVEFAWSPDYFLESGESAALAGSLSVPLADTFLFFDGGVSASGQQFDLVPVGIGDHRDPPAARPQFGGWLQDLHPARRKSRHEGIDARDGDPDVSVQARAGVIRRG